VQVSAWGAGAFDNDDAADWDLDFENADQATGLKLIADALTAAAQADSSIYLDAPDGSRAVAAAEAVASINKQLLDESAYNQRVRQWITRTGPGPEARLTELARRAVQRVTSQNSELAQLWDESGPSSWRSTIDELRAALDR